MDQQFESDVMHDLMADSPTVSADEAFEEELYDDGFEDEGFEENAMMDNVDQYDEAAEDEDDTMDAMEAAVADALDAEDSDEFLRRLISGIRGVAGAVRRGAGVASSVAGGVQRVAGQVGRAAQSIQGIANEVDGGMTQGRKRSNKQSVKTARQGILPILQRHATQGTNEMDLFEDLVDWFEQEEADEALPIVAGVAARTALRPLIRRGGTATGRVINRQLVHGTTQAAQNLIRRQGTQAVRALHPIAASVGRVAARRGMRATALSNAIRRTTASVAAQPTLTRRLVQTTIRINRRLPPRTHLNVSVGSVPRRFVVNGSVEIIIRR